MPNIVSNIVVTDVVHGSGAELWEEDLDPEALEVLDDEGPDVEDVVAGERLALLKHHDLNGNNTVCHENYFLWVA